MKIDYDEYRKLELRWSYPRTKIKKAIYLYLLEMQSLPGFDHNKIQTIDTKPNRDRIIYNHRNGVNDGI